MGAMGGTLQEGSIPTWMEVFFVTTFFSQQFPKDFFGKIYMNEKQFDWWKKFYKNLEEWVSKPLALGDEHNIQALWLDFSKILIDLS